MNVRRLPCFAVPLAAALFLASCEGDRGPAGPAAPDPAPYVMGSVYYGSYDNSGYGYASISNLGVMPDVTFNGVPSLLSSPVNPPNPLAVLAPDLSFSPGDSVHLDLAFPQPGGQPGNAHAVVVIPDTFHLVYPEPEQNFDLPIGSDFTARWTRSNHAQAYRVRMVLRYVDLDTTLGSLIPAAQTHQVLDTLVADTTVVLSGQRLFPDPAWASAWDQREGEFSVSAHYGPWQPGAPGNVNGDGRGFFFARTIGETIWMDLVSLEPARTTTVQPELSVRR
ncbi:MAG: hypothetical protein C4524_08210 [Candidatus Zixiibacteriota bacterium]|nr:MAG: hypothetical protein C4524_08210 [candidate division Zixibacteria bacterium]